MIAFTISSKRAWRYLIATTKFLFGFTKTSI